MVGWKLDSRYLWKIYTPTNQMQEINGQKRWNEKMCVCFECFFECVLRTFIIIKSNNII